MADETALIHPTAVVDDDVEIGADTKVWHFVHVSSGARIGRGCSLGQNVYIGNDVPIGNRVRVQNNVSIYSGVEVGDDVFLGPSCVFTNVVSPRAAVQRNGDFGRTLVGRGATIGANATIVCGHDIGPYAFIGAGAVVTKDIPAHALMVGNPARRIGWMCQCGEQLEVEPSETHETTISCQSCALSYRVDPNTCVPMDPR